MLKEYRARISATYKNADTEEWIDIRFTRPIGYLWALFFKKLHVVPNVVTILSIIIGIAAGWMFYYQDIYHNIAGVLLLMWANFYDSADGQLARMTGKKTRWGRMLDGFAGDLWFFAIYLAIVLRLWNEFIPFTHVHWKFLILFLAIFSGVFCHAKQCQLADYYRNVHMFFAFGKEDSELDNSRQQRVLLNTTPKKGNFWWRAFLYFYGNYTHSQESLTPCLQDLMNVINNERGGNIPEKFRLDFRKESKPMMKYANILTFNWRAITLYVSCLLNIPWLYIVIEIVVFTSLAYYLRERHEKLCRQMTMLLEKGYYDETPTLI